MKFKYISLNEGFYHWLETNYLPIGSQIMFLKLIHLFNASGWCEWLAVDNHRIMSLVQTNREQSVIEWRNKLLENNLIVYKKGKKGLPNKYKLNENLAFIKESVAYSIVQNGESVGYSVVNSGVYSVAIYRKDKDKDKDNNKKEKNKKKTPSHTYGEFSNVLLCDDEFKKLQERLGRKKTLSYI